MAHPGSIARCCCIHQSAAADRRWGFRFSTHVKQQNWRFNHSPQQGMTLDENGSLIYLIFVWLYCLSWALHAQSVVHIKPRVHALHELE